MQCRHEEDVVALLQNVCTFAFELPVGVINEHQNSRASEGALVGRCQFLDSLQTQYHEAQTTLSCGLS